MSTCGDQGVAQDLLAQGTQACVWYILLDEHSFLGSLWGRRVRLDLADHHRQDPCFSGLRTLARVHPLPLPLDHVLMDRL